MEKKDRGARWWIFSVLVMVVFVTTSEGAEQFPTKPIRLISHMGPGSMNDLACRLVSEPLSKLLGVPVAVENKTGGGGSVGGDYVAKSKPDGYTILCGSAAVISLIPILTPSLYKTEDFVPICLIARSPYVVSVSSQSPFKTFDALLENAKKNPGKLIYGSAGHGSLGYFAFEVLKFRAGADITFLPSTAGTTNVTGLLGGHMDVIFDSLVTQRGLIESGKIRPLIVLPKTRFLPDLPSFEEKGFGEAVAATLGFYVPKGTPEPIVKKLTQAFEKAIVTPAITKQADVSGFNVDFVPGEVFSKEIARQVVTLRETAKKLGLVK